MNFKDAGSSLREYNKWRRGKGRKYSHPGFPFDVSRIGIAIETASSVMRRFPDVEDFLCLEDVFKFCIHASRRMCSPITKEERRSIRNFRKLIRYMKSNEESFK